MKVQFYTVFDRDLKKINDRKLRRRIRDTIAQVEAAESLASIGGVKKLQGYERFYRIRVGEFRLGIEATGNTVSFVRCLDRKEFYRYFP